MTGSQKNAAMFSGPMRSKAAASAATSSCGTELVAGSKTPKPARFASMPARLVPNPWVPW
jgi:hypothetical protein